MRPKDPRFSDPTDKNRTTLATPAKKNCFFERRFPELHRCRHLRTCWRTHEVSFSIARRQDEQNRSAALHRTGRAAPPKFVGEVSQSPVESLWNRAPKGSQQV